MDSLFFEAIYESWKPIQMAKYQELLPLFKQHLPKKGSLLDYGIGPGWLELFLQENQFSFSKIIGFDLNPLVVAQKIESVEYIIGKELQTSQTFDTVCCFDTIHLVKNVDLMNFVKKEGYLFVSIPNTFKDRLTSFNGKLITEKTIGTQEKSFFQLWQKV